ncbi:MAG: ABC transporter ATP-binding protein [candidate division Zixibacteria bacterium]|nr:ABC transporter ATP-binding protein [candidate division Zixibacteria bacterium]
MTRELFNLEGITKIYRRGKEEIKGVNGITLKIKKGEYISILGPSGAGKTTFLNMLGCIDSPTSGKLVFYPDNEKKFDLTDMKENKLDEFRRENIGFVFADFFLIPSLTATENVELPLLFSSDKKVEQDYSKKVLETVGLGHRLTHKPLHLAGGEMQRVAVARSIVNRPKVLLADEPTANLDTGNSEVIFNLFEELNSKGMTVVVATHAEELARRAKRIIFLLDGKIVEDKGGR